MGRLFSALGYYLSLKFLWSSEKVRQSADGTFTSSAEGIGMAYDLAQDEMVQEFNTLRDAIAEVEGVLEDQRDRFAELNTEEEDLLQKREGALRSFERAEAEGNKVDAQKHQAAFERYDARIQVIETEQAELEESIKQQEAGMSVHFANLTKFQADIKKLPAEKAAEIAKFVSNKKTIELYDRLNGVKKSFERGPLDAVRAKNKQLSAKAKIATKMAGADVDAQDAQYEAEGKRATSSDRMNKMLAARRAERAASTGETTQVVNEKPAERPTI